MPTYILLVNMTDQGARGVREIPSRQAASAELTKALGIKKQVYMTFGPYDFVQILEAEDEASIAKYVLKLNSIGNVRTTTLRAFDEDEHHALIKGVA